MRKLCAVAVILALVASTAHAVGTVPPTDGQILNRATSLQWFDQSGAILSTAQVERLQDEGLLIPMLRDGELSYQDEFLREEPDESSIEKVLIEPANDAASKELGAGLGFVCCGAGWAVEGGTRYRRGSGFLIYDEPNATFITTSKHVAFRESTGATWPILRFCFEPCFYDGFPKDTTSYVPEKTYKAVAVIYHPSADLALVKLDRQVCNSDGTPRTPAEIYTGELTLNTVCLFAGAGDTGTPSQGGTQGTDIYDGFLRAAYGSISQFGHLGMDMNIAYMKYNVSLPLPGIGCVGDSGGPVIVAIGGQSYVVGIIDQGRGAGTLTITGFERFGYYAGFQTWLEETIAANTTVPDTTAPTGTVTVNSGATYTKALSVTLALSATDDEGGSGVTEMAFSLDGTVWTSWEAYATTRGLTLAAPDGTKTVYVKYRDGAGNVSAESSDSIVLDTTPPVMANINTALHKGTSKAITFSASDALSGPVSYEVVTGPSHGTFTGTAPALQYTPSENYVGSDTIAVKATDKAGNATTATASISVTNTAPTVTGQSLTTKMNEAVAVTLSGSDPDGDALTWSVSAASHGTVSGEGTSRTYKPNTGYTGTDSFTVRANDGAADSNLATITITVQAVVTTGSLKVTIAPSEAVADGRWKVDGGAWQVSGATVSGLTAGSHAVSFKDIGVLWSTPQGMSVAIAVGQTTQVIGTYLGNVPQDTTPPVGTVIINSGAATTSSTAVTLSLDAADEVGGSGVTDIRLSSNGTNWFAWEPYATTVDYTLTDGNGTKTVYVQFRDAAGNISATVLDNIELKVVAPTGSLTVTITPSEADGRWRVDGGAWQESGATVSGLSVGNHTVDFLDIPDEEGSGCHRGKSWSTPTTQAVTVSAEATTQAAAEYLSGDAKALKASVGGDSAVLSLIVGCLTLTGWRRRKVMAL